MRNGTFAGLAAVLLLGGTALVAGAAEAPDYLHSPSAAAQYGAIDGHKIWAAVVEQAGIAERYRDNGHPQFWGRISGTSADAEDAQWLVEKIRASRVERYAHPDRQLSQPPMGPQILARGVDRRRQDRPLASAQPTYGSPAAKDLDLEIAYVGFGSEADFAHQDLRGKAVLLIKSTLSRQIGPQDILKRAEAHGAAAIFSTDLRGKNQYAADLPRLYQCPDFSSGHRG